MQSIPANGTQSPRSTRNFSLLAPVYAGQAVAGVVDDVAWVDAMLEVELALARAQADLGLVPARVAESIAAVRDTHRFDVEALAYASRAAANPVVPFVAELIRAVSEIDSTSADYVHHGSTSQDILDTATMLVATRALAVITEDLKAVAAALAGLAEQHRATPAVARTLSMHAVPTTFGLRVAGWLSGILDAYDRIEPLAHGGLPVQFGGAGGTLSGYVESAMPFVDDRGDAVALCMALHAKFADLLGLRTSTLPWQVPRAPIADLASALAVAVGALGKLASDVATSTRTEVAEVFEPHAVGRGASSAMPHKRNPVSSTLIRSAALQLPGLVATLHAAMVFDDERPAGAWHAEWQPLRECLLLTGGAAATAVELVRGLTVDMVKMRANLELTAGAVVSERLAVRLTPLLGRAAVKRALHSAFEAAERSERGLGALLAEDPVIGAHLTAEEISASLVPETYLGASGVLVDHVLDRYHVTIAQDRSE